MKDLHQYVDPSILPGEYGGRMPAWGCEDIAQRVLDKEDYFNYNRKFGYPPDNHWMIFFCFWRRGLKPIIFFCVIYSYINYCINDIVEAPGYLLYFKFVEPISLRIL